MWEPFTEAARNSIVLARDEAEQLGQPHIATEHLLLGIIAHQENMAARTLRKLGVDRAKVLREVQGIMRNSSSTPVSEDFAFTPRAKRVIELAFEEARAQHHNYIGTEHLLLGLVQENQGIASRVLANLGVEHSQVFWELVVSPALDTVLKPPSS